MKPRRVAIWVCGLMPACLVGCAGMGGAPARAPATTEQVELTTLSEMLQAADTLPRGRFQAATLLLAKPDERAGRILLSALSDRPVRPSGIAVAQALAETGQCPREFRAPLFALLGEDDPSARAAAASALGASHDPDVRDRLCHIAQDEDRPLPMRVSAVAALGAMVDRESIDVLVGLLEDSQSDVRAAVAESLARLTGIRTVGADAAAWRGWWHANRDLPREQWLVALAEGLAQRNAALSAELALVRRRLAETIRMSHEGTPPAKRAEMVLALLQDPLPEVRAVGLELATRQLAAREPLAPWATEIVRTLVDDSDPAVRASAAVLLAGLLPPGADEVLLSRLKIETSPEVRIALIKSLGALRSPAAVEPLLVELADGSDGQAVAAAAAIARLAESGLLTEPRASQAAEVIVRRYERAGGAEPLRAALLSAMRGLGRPAFVPVIRAALADPSPAVRLEALRGLTALRAATAEDVVPLTRDGDRGVRQSAMEALAGVGDARHVALVLERTLAAEADPAVRQKAWETMLALLEKAETAQVADVAEALADRPEAQDYRIRVLTMLVERHKDSPTARSSAQAQVAGLLLSADRAAQAAEVLAAALPGAPEERRGHLWLMWIDALLRSDDPMVVTQLADQSDAALFAGAVDRLTARLEALRGSDRHAAAVLLADQALQRLDERLPETTRQDIAACRAECERRRREADAARVSGLLKALNGADPGACDQARRELTAMGKRALGPLVEQFRAALNDQAARDQMEKNVPPLLGAIDPQFAGYDVNAPLDERIRLVDAWVQKAQP